MPQFSPAFLISQIFWLIISFGGLYLIILLFVFPRYKRIFNMRFQEIDGKIEQAEKLVQEAEFIQEQTAKKRSGFLKKQEEKVNKKQQQLLLQAQQKIKEAEKKLMKQFERKIQKMEQEEQEALKMALKGMG